MTLDEQIRWLKLKQQYARACLHDAERMVVGDILIANARADLEASTALLATLAESGAGLPLFQAVPGGKPQRRPAARDER